MSPTDPPPRAEGAERTWTELGDDLVGSLRAPRTDALVADWIRRKILEGELPPGSLLPAERILAVKLDINRHTLRTALTRLQAEGLISIRQGEGARVLDFRRSANIDLLQHIPSKDKSTLLRGFLELRRAVAVEAIGLACERATAEALERLEALATIQQGETDINAFMARELEISREILRIADNLPMELLFNSFITFSKARQDFDALRAPDLDATRRTTTLTLDVLRRGDPKAARDAARSWLEQRDATILARFEDSIDARTND